ncbi:fumarylacetoacetate hydrolase family protein [bacterium]|nr:fumarylacetoacetate hydrolase family protein [bacterium]
MRLFNYERSGEARSGLWLNGRGYDLEALLGEDCGGPLGPRNLGSLPAWQARLAERAPTVPPLPTTGWRWLPPLLPAASFRDFYAFETHVRQARARRGLEVPAAWYRFPVFYFSNPHALFGHEAEIPLPPDAAEEWLDFELEIGAVLGAGGRDLTPAAAEALIAGYCVLNDWSARRVQRDEMSVGLGPAKGKDFATSLGPFLVTPDELADRRQGKGYALTMVARRGGRELCRASWDSIHYSFGEMISRASQGVDLLPGELFGSGTVGGGCILELGEEAAGGWLAPGDRVELEIERLGTLTGTIAAS